MDGPSPQELPMPSTAAAMAAQLKELAAQSQRKLAADPHDAKAMAAMALVALGSGQSENAVRMAWAATEEDPAMIPA